MSRVVIFGRKTIVPAAVVAYHWAIKVGDTWYEVAGAGKDANSAPNVVNRSQGPKAASGAAKECVLGRTAKSDQDIDVWIKDWLEDNQAYDFLEENCQKFVLEFAHFLIPGGFDFPYRLNAGNVGVASRDFATAYAVAAEGSAKAGIQGPTLKASKGPLQVSGRVLKLEAQATSTGDNLISFNREHEDSLGLFADASLVRAEVSLGNVVGVHLDPNVNTGFGVRNGNMEVHLLGFGTKAGRDGLEIDTPLGGVSACALM